MKLSRGSLIIILITLAILLIGVVQLLARGFVTTHASSGPCFAASGRPVWVYCRTR